MNSVSTIRTGRRWLPLIFLLAVAGVKGQEHNPNLAAEYFKRGVTQYRSGSFTEALEQFSKAIQLNPQLSSAYYYRATIRATKGSFKEAIIDYDQVIQLNPLQATAHYNRGVAHFALWDLGAAVED